MDTIRYIIVVHGIGEQRKNETVLKVVNRFAEIRAKTSPKENWGILTLGKATGQTGKDRFLDPCRFDPPKSDFIPWMEFKGIPQDPNVETTDPFYGETSVDGSNLRFVDLCWADIMQQDFPHAGQKVEDWARGLVGRLQRKSKFYKESIEKALKRTKQIEENAGELEEIKKEATDFLKASKEFIQISDQDLKKISDAGNAQELKDAWQEIETKLDQLPEPADENFPLSSFGPVPKWVLKILKQLAKTLILIRESMTFPMNKFTGRFFGGERTEDLLFNKFLGDVQLYGEYLPTRGRAVQRFHKLMWHIHTKHWEREEHRKGSGCEMAQPQYTILAHSLGTVMSMDALVSAHLDIPTRSGISGGIPNFPFQGYCQENPEQIQTAEEEIRQLEGKNQLTAVEKEKLENAKLEIGYLDTSWIKQVDSFVTLGSPIDKFLVLWWLNYSYLNSSDWANGWNRSGERIKHFNYTDEQDPVGHALDKFQDTQAFKSFFEKGEDRVFNRYVFPGVAHLKYWNDLELFRHIAHKAVDRTDPSIQEPGWFKPWIYIKVVFITYFLIPLGLTLVLFFIGTGALEEAEWYKRLPTTAAFVLAGWLSLKLIHLLVWWRQIMRQKASEHFIKKKKEGIDLGELSFRTWAARISRLLVYLFPIVFSILARDTFQQTLSQPSKESFQFLIFYSLGALVFGWVAIVFSYLKLKN